jgi:signal transduction histidine kinase/ligand-binding sensor domain-containing protein
MSKMTLFSSFRYCLLVVVLTSIKVHCQENYTARWYTADNNELPQSSVKAIAQDKYNFIWMTTENGVVRYDGNSFLTFNSSNTNLKQCRFTEILGNIQKDSLFCYNTDKKELILINQRKIQLIKKAGPAYNITRNGQRFYYHDGLPSNNTINSREPYYVRTSSGNIFFIDTQKIELCNAKLQRIYKINYKSESVFKFFVLNNTLFYLKENGNYDCFSEQGKFPSTLHSSFLENKYRLYWNISANQVFIYSKNNIYLLTTTADRLSFIPIVNFKEFEKGNIVSLLYDNKNHKLYLGSYTNGLCIITFPDFNTVKKDLHKSAEIYYGSIAASNNTLITAEGLIFTNKKVIDSLSFVKSTYLNEHITIAKDADENLWIGRAFNIYCYLKKANYKKYKTYKFRQYTKAIFKDQSNTIWISLAKDESQKAKLYSIKEGALSLVAVFEDNINHIAQYDDNTLYLGTEIGLYKYEKEEKKLFFIKNSKKIHVRGIFIDSGKKIWLTTYEKGFFLYSDKVFHTFPKDEHNYLNSSHCIIEDKNGFFWIPTNKGLFQMSRKALLDYSKNKKRSIYYHQYNKTDGFLTNEFNGGCQPCGNFLKNDQIALPSMNGFVFFNPYKITPLLPSQELFIDKVLVDQKVFYPKDTIVLNNNFQRISFSIVYSYYGNPENINIEARLDKIANSRWEKVREDNVISFTTLPPGEYTLIIRNLSGFDGKYAYKKFTIIIPAKFHQTVWFEILCCVLVLLFLIFVWYVRLYYIELKNIELQEIIAKKTKKLARTVRKLKTTEKDLKQEIKQQETLVKSISHDIKSPLKFLTSSINHLSDNINSSQDKKLKRQIETIQLSSDQLYEYVENLIKYSTIFSEGKKLEDKSYSLYDLIEEKIQIFGKIAAVENTIIINNVDQNLFIRTNNKALSIIVHNLLDNAIKNTKNGKIELVSLTRDNMLTLTILDNGKGMSKELIDYYLDFHKNPIVKNYHLGLHMIIELLLIIKGNINIKSTINEGTTIEIMVEFD